jgi:hypothetical protein
MMRNSATSCYYEQICPTSPCTRRAKTHAREGQTLALGT